MRLVPQGHPLQHLFSHWRTARHANKFWRDSCTAAVKRAASYISSHATCLRPALARHPKGRHMREYMDVLWLPSDQSIAWIDLTGREETPEEALMEAPIICTVAMNARAPWISHNVIYRFMHRHGCRPPRVDCRPGDGDTPAAFAHPPGLLIQCHVSEVERWTLQAAQWGLGWVLGDTAPFPRGTLPSAHWQAGHHELWTPRAREAKEAWDALLRAAPVGRLLRDVLRICRASSTRSCRHRQA